MLRMTIFCIHPLLPWHEAVFSRGIDHLIGAGVRLLRRYSFAALTPLGGIWW